HFMENGRISESWSSDLSDLREGKRHNASMFLDYGPDGNNTFSFSAILAIRPNNRGVDDSKTNISTANDPNTTGFFTNNESELESINAGFYLDYERKLNDKGASLNLDSHFAYYNYDRDQVL